jgi:septal ring factor EnvC (AmiA/AmiB activator)
MNALSLALRAIAIVGAIAAGVLWFISEGKLEEKQTELTQTRQTLEQTRSTLAQTDAQLDSAQDELEETTADLDRAEDELQDKELALNEARKRVRQLEDEVDAQEALIAQKDEEIRRQKAAQIAAIDEKDKRITELNRTVSDLQQDVATLRDDLLTAENRLEEATTSMQTAAAETTTAPDAGTDGQSTQQRPTRFSRTETVQPLPAAGNISEVSVLRVDPDKRTVVLDFGAEAGAKQNQGLVLLEDGRKLASLRLLNVVPTASVAYVERDSRIPREGQTYTLVR